MSVEDVYRIAFKKIYHALAFVDPETTEAHDYHTRAQAMCRFALGLGADPDWSDEQLEVAEGLISELVDEIDELIDAEECNDR